MVDKKVVVKKGRKNDKLSLEKLKRQSNEKDKIKNFHELIENFSAEEELAKNDYIYLFKISTINEKGEESIYVKCINKRGQYVYVLIDEGYLPSRNKDLEYLESQESFIPLSFKAGVLDCAELGVCGVAFDCNNSICVIKLDDTLKPIEKTFKIVSDRPEKLAISENEVVPYPIITLGEIKFDPEGILEICDNIVKKIREQFFGKVEKNLEVLKCNVNLMSDKVVKCYKFLLETECKMKDTFEQLEDYDKILTENPPILEENKCKQRSIKYNLRKANESFIEFVNVNSSLYEENKKIVEIISKMDEFLAFCEKEFSYTGYVKSEN